MLQGHGVMAPFLLWARTQTQELGTKMYLTKYLCTQQHTDEACVKEKLIQLSTQFKEVCSILLHYTDVFLTICDTIQCNVTQKKLNTVNLLL